MLLATSEFSESLNKAISQSQQQIVVASAFIKNDALRRMLENSGHNNIKIVARWLKHDLITGASDLSVFSLCRENNWQFGVCQNLHGKIYLIDEQSIFLGSANLTRRGLNLCSSPNLEFGTQIPAEQADLDKINGFINQEVAWITDDQFHAIEQDIEERPSQYDSVSDIKWSSSISDFLAKKVNYLWVQELAFKRPQEILNLDLNDEQSLHDYDLFNLDIDNLSAESLKSGFIQSRLNIWLQNQLKNETSLSFGALTHALHNSLLDDPLPYRKEIKEFVSILMAWCEFNDEVYEVIRPSHSQILSLKST